MSKKDGMVQMAELTVYQMRKVVRREWIECSGGVGFAMPSLKHYAECVIRELRDQAFIANDGSTQIPVEDVFGKFTYKLKPMKMYVPAYYETERKDNGTGKD